MAMILIVDDESFVRAVVEEILTSGGHTVLQAISGAEAVKMCAERSFDLVITDLRMQNVSGVDFGRQILELRPETPIILMTGYSGTLDAEGVRRLGFRELLLKPYTARGFAECVHRVLSERPKR